MDADHPIRQFWSSSEEVYCSLVALEPTRFDLYFAFTWLLEGYARLILDPSLFVYLADIKITKSKVQERAKKVMDSMKDFCELFNFAEARLLMWKGTFQYLSGNVSKAKQNWIKSLEKAKERNFKWEEAFTLYIRGRLLKSQDDSSAALQICPDLSHFDDDVSSQNIQRRFVHTTSLANFFPNSSPETVRSPRQSHSPTKERKSQQVPQSPALSQKDTE